MSPCVLRQPPHDARGECGSSAACVEAHPHAQDGLTLLCGLAVSRWWARPISRLAFPFESLGVYQTTRSTLRCNRPIRNPESILHELAKAQMRLLRPKWGRHDGASCYACWTGHDCGHGVSDCDHGVATAVHNSACRYEARPTSVHHRHECTFMARHDLGEAFFQSRRGGGGPRSMRSLRSVVGRD